jgi:hypothetical protein
VPLLDIQLKDMAQQAGSLVNRDMFRGTGRTLPELWEEASGVGYFLAPVCSPRLPEDKIPTLGWQYLWYSVELLKRPAASFMAQVQFSDLPKPWRLELPAELSSEVLLPQSDLALPQPDHSSAAIPQEVSLMLSAQLVECF